MLVILTEDQLLSPQVVCQSCLLADCQGPTAMAARSAMLWSVA